MTFLIVSAAVVLFFQNIANKQEKSSVEKLLSAIALNKQSIMMAR